MAKRLPRNEAVYEAVYAREKARGVSEAYAKRQASSQARGKTRQQARGHKEHEHRTREQRAQAAGRLTEADKRWLKRQQNRIKVNESSALGRERWARAIAEFAAMSPDQRFEVRREQQERQRSMNYASMYPPHPDNVLSPLYLSSRSGLR